MSDSIYATPEAAVDVAEQDEARYYIVSPNKFLVLAIATFNLYFVYWFYKNWDNVKRRDNDDSWPVPRAIFYIFFTHSLLTDVSETLKRKTIEFAWQPSAIASVFVILTIADTVIGRLAFNNVGSPFTDMVGIAMAVVLPLVLLPAQKAINSACEDSEGNSNSSLTVVNWVWIVLGGLFWLVTLTGLYFMFTQPELFAE